MVRSELSALLGHGGVANLYSPRQREKGHFGMLLEFYKSRHQLRGWCHCRGPVLSGPFITQEGKGPVVIWYNPVPRVGLYMVIGS